MKVLRLICMSICCKRFIYNIHVYICTCTRYTLASIYMYTCTTSYIIIFYQLLYVIVHVSRGGNVANYIEFQQLSNWNCRKANTCQSEHSHDLLEFWVISKILELANEPKVGNVWNFGKSVRWNIWNEDKFSISNEYLVHVVRVQFNIKSIYFH